MIVQSFWSRHLANLQNNPGLGAALSSLFSSSCDSLRAGVAALHSPLLTLKKKEVEVQGLKSEKAATPVTTPLFFISAGPMTKMFAWGEVENGGHVR
jgi:hypothetical protein